MLLSVKGIGFGALVGIPAALLSMLGDWPHPNLATWLVLICWLGLPLFAGPYWYWRRWRMMRAEFKA